jgi:FkbM family methyltransferase
MRPGDVVFDIGANMGDRVAVFHELGARVVAVEPQPACIERLRERFGDSVTVVEAVAGPSPGEADLLVASYHTLATLSPEWVDEVRGSGRFGEFNWDGRLKVPMTTLDELIATYGTPVFCKIDVEGFELGVLEGLSKRIRALSFEFTFELLPSRLLCVERLAALGMAKFNFSEGESTRLTWKRWIGPDQMLRFLESTPRDVGFFGDVYAAN